MSVQNNLGSTVIWAGCCRKDKGVMGLNIVQEESGWILGII